MKFDLILENGNVIDDNGEIYKNKSIYIKEGKIIKIEKYSKDDEFEAEKIIDCTNKFISPGLVNLHVHSAMNIFKGIAEDVDEDTWFNEEIWPYESNMTPDDVYVGALASIHEMINNGVTAFADHYMEGEKIAKAIIETGIKGDVALTIFGMLDNFEEELNKVGNIIRDRKNENPRLKLRFGPHAPYTCPGDTLKMIIDRAIELDTGVHIHLSETERQVLKSIENSKKTPFEVMNDAGGFEVPCIVAHGLWMKKEDEKFLNQNTFIAACPKTYMKLSSGYGTLWDDFQNKPLAVGTDGAASSNTLDPIEQLRLYALIGKIQKNDAEDFKLKDMWKMLMRGHYALDFNSGKIEKGYSADLLVWDLNKINTLPLYNPLASIIYSSNSSNITYNIVNGKILKDNGKVDFPDIDIKEKLVKTSEDILKRSKGKTKLIY
jgi:5-methylthioadenosine/S-adenosylhomocysteine deaminase